jgi:hypothetical protein
VLDLAKEMNDFYFLVLGDGPEKNRLLERIRLENIENIKLLGHVNDTYNYYNIFDAFILLSKMEGTPISIIEAMASGVPVFSNGVGAIPDLIKDNETGFIIKESDDLKSKIANNLSNNDIIKNARNFVVENHDIIKNNNKFLSLFNSIYDFVPGKYKDYKNVEIKGDVSRVRTINKGDVKKLNNSDLVTVVINNYNKGTLLRKAVNSALAQTHYNLEIIVIDDNSNDDVSNILTGIEDPRVNIYLNKKNCGAYACRNFAIEHSKGRYITFLDSDDYIVNDHIAHLLGAIHQFNLKAVNSKYKRVDDKNKTIAESRCEAAILFDRSVINDVGYFHMVRASADSEFRERLTKYYGNDKVALLKYTSYVATNLEGSLTQSKKTGFGSTARKDYNTKFRNNKNLYYHYKNSMDFLKLHKDIISIPLDFNNFVKIK